MSVKERDPLTGHQTTGHEWAGITELNTRVPRVEWLAIWVTHIWALVYWVLMPAWPLVETYTRGLLGYDPQERVEEDVVEAQAARSDWAARIEAAPVAEVLSDPALLAVVDQAAPALFGDNCAGCHGQDGQGAQGFPSLADGDWLWGDDPEAILETLRIGINSTHPETRYSEMPAFGPDVLPRGERRLLVEHVLSLSGTPLAGEEGIAAAELFAANCAGCHGEGGEGNMEIGAPNLTDDAWLYGGQPEDVEETIHNGRQGWMPHWEGRLSEVDRKMLAAYLLGLGGEGGP